MPCRRRHLFPAALVAALVAPLLSATSVLADVRLPALFGDHMVLQRQVSVRLWGWAGVDGLFHPARARIDGATLVLFSLDVTVPTQARFAWDESAEPNLVNGAGLPASPFFIEVE